MIQKLFVLSCSLALARAGIIGTHFSPSTSVSSVYSSINNPAAIGTPVYEKSATVTHFGSPAPVYESVVSTHESKTKGLDGSQQTTYSKSLDTPYSSVKKYDTRVTNDGIFAPAVYSSPVQTSYLYNPGAYSVASPLSHSFVSNSVAPVTYTTHQSSPLPSNAFLTKTITPSYISHDGQTIKTTVTYSEAPLVSHMTFTGLGTSYAW